MNKDDVVDPHNLTGYRNSHSKVSARLGVFSLLGIVVLVTFFYTWNIYGLDGKWMYNESIPSLAKGVLVVGIAVNMVIGFLSALEGRIAGTLLGPVSAVILYCELFK